MKTLLHRPHYLFWLAAIITLVLILLHPTKTQVYSLYGNYISLKNWQIGLCSLIYFISVGMAYFFAKKNKKTLYPWLTASHTLGTLMGFALLYFLPDPFKSNGPKMWEPHWYTPFLIEIKKITAPTVAVVQWFFVCNLLLAYFYNPKQAK